MLYTAPASQAFSLPCQELHDLRFGTWRVDTVSVMFTWTAFDDGGWIMRQIYPSQQGVQVIGETSAATCAEHP